MEAKEARLPVIDDNYKPLMEGLFNIDDETYFRIDAYSNSCGKFFRQSPAHVKAAQDETVDTSSMAMREGSALHLAILQPKLYEIMISVDPGWNKNSNQYKEWEAEQVAVLQEGHDGKQTAVNKIILPAKTVNGISQAMREVQQRKSVQNYLQSGWAEKVALWFEPEYGIWCKGKLDWITADGKCLVDLKKSRNASKRQFERSIFSYQYYHQAYHYMRGFTHITGNKPQQWLWLAVEIEAPYGANILRADLNEVDAAETEVLSWYEQYAQCKATGEWPNYPDAIMDLGYFIDPESDDIIGDLPF